MKNLQTREYSSDLKTREENDEKELIIEGYFAVFGSETELFPGGFEEIRAGAFDKSLSNDIKALVNHDHTLVLGRTKANTVELKTDSRGLYGVVKINKNDSDAMNLYERVKRGDVDQCSFGFNINSEETEFRDDGSVKWTLTDIDLHEISICTFPAYENTGVHARSKDMENLRKTNLNSHKENLKARLLNA